MRLIIALFIITSNSMNPFLMASDIVVVCRICPARTGDIITFKVGDNHFVTHRVSGMNGAVFITKGDRNAQTDEYHTTATDVIGKVVLRIPTSFIWFSLRRKN